MNQPFTNPTSAQPTTTPPLPPQRVAFIQSCWHRDIVDQCRLSFVKEMMARGLPERQIDLFEVPGAFEIPLQAKLLPRPAATRRSSLPASSSMAASTVTNSWRAR